MRSKDSLIDNPQSTVEVGAGLIGLTGLTGPADDIALAEAYR